MHKQDNNIYLSGAIIRQYIWGIWLHKEPFKTRCILIKMPFFYLIYISHRYVDLVNAH